MGNCLKRLKKKLPSIASKPLIVPPIFSGEPENENLIRVFSFVEVKKATKKFREKKLVKCEDGCVRCFYKGYINETTFAPSRTGTGIAVSVMECDDSRSLQDWMAIVKSLGQISHPNLVKLLGYCCEDNKSLFLVFEHLHNGSLDHHIFTKEEEALPWEIRVKIAIGTAQALAYLHSIKNGAALHQELRMYNILLDEQYNTKLFYLESNNEWLEDKTIIGQFRYFTPEFLFTGHLGMETDVYALGVILLELLIGSEYKVKDKQSLLLPDNYKIEEIIDPRLGNDYPANAATQMGTLINRCTELDMKKRPLTQHVLDALNDIAEIKD